MIHREIEYRKAPILRWKEAAIRGIVFYAAGPFKVEGLGYMPVRTATICRQGSGDDLLRRLSETLRL